MSCSSTLLHFRKTRKLLHQNISHIGNAYDGFYRAGFMLINNETVLIMKPQQSEHTFNIRKSFSKTLLHFCWTSMFLFFGEKTVSDNSTQRKLRMHLRTILLKIWSKKRTAFSYSLSSHSKLSTPSVLLPFAFILLLATNKANKHSRHQKLQINQLIQNPPCFHYCINIWKMLHRTLHKKCISIHEESKQTVSHRSISQHD